MFAVDVTVCRGTSGLAPPSRTRLFRTLGMISCLLASPVLPAATGVIYVTRRTPAVIGVRLARIADRRWGWHCWAASRSSMRRPMRPMCGNRRHHRCRPGGLIWSDPTTRCPSIRARSWRGRKWLNLNGLWGYTGRPAKAAATAPPPANAYREQILVPFPTESALSGIQRHDDQMWYRKVLRFRTTGTTSMCCCISAPSTRSLPSG